MIKSCAPSNSPVVFVARGLGREVAMLGAVEVGEVLPFNAGGRCAAYWRTRLPDDDVRAPVGVTSMDAARAALCEQVWQWLERAGLTIVRSQPVRQAAAR